MACNVNIRWHFFCNIYTFEQDIRVCIHSVVFDLSIYDVILVFLFSPNKMIGRKVDDKSCLSFSLQLLLHTHSFSNITLEDDKLQILDWPWWSQITIRLKWLKVFIFSVWYWVSKIKRINRWFFYNIYFCLKKV